MCSGHFEDTKASLPSKSSQKKITIETVLRARTAPLFNPTMASPDDDWQFPLDMTRFKDEQDLALVLEKLRARARAEAAVRVSPDGLDIKRRDTLVRAINNVLSTNEAMFTFAQIIDGLPTADVGWDRRSTGLWGDHPLDAHEELCPGAMEKVQEVCPKWNLSMLRFNPKVGCNPSQTTST